MRFFNNNLRERLANNRESTLSSIYKKTFPMVSHFVRKNQGNEDDAKDIMQEGMIFFYEKIVSGQLELSSKESTYIFGVCKNLWLNQRRKNDKETHLNISEEIQIPMEDTAEVEFVDFKETLLKLGENCYRLLVGFYYDGFDIKRIASSFGYSSEHTASVQKYKCLERLRKIVPNPYTSLS